MCTVVEILLKIRDLQYLTDLTFKGGGLSSGSVIVLSLKSPSPKMIEGFGFQGKWIQLLPRMKLAVIHLYPQQKR